MRILALLLAALLAIGLACGPSQHQVAHVSVLSLGGGLELLHREHQRVYVRATDQLRLRLADAGGTIAEYDRGVAVINAEFSARTDAIAALDADLYTAAAISDAMRRDGARQFRPAACRLATSLDLHLAALAGGGLLPPVPVPRELTVAVHALRALAAPCEVPDAAH